MGDGVGEVFQRETRYHRSRMRGYVLDWDARPPAFKTYRDAPIFELPSPTTGATAMIGVAGGSAATAMTAPIAMTDPTGMTDAAKPSGSADLWAAIAHRRSLRQFADKPVTLGELSQLLWAGAGVTRVSPNQLYRASPSAGALYPIETYVVVNRVEGLPAGLYHYRVALPDEDGTVDPTTGHCLEQLRTLDLGAAVANAALEQGIAARAAVIFIWTAIVGRSAWKYRQRAYRYIYLDAGHAAAHVSLAAVGLGLGSCQIAAFFDDEMDGILGIDGEEEATLYLTVVGHPPRTDDQNAEASD